MDWGPKIAAAGVVLALAGAVPLVSAIQRKDAQIAAVKLENAGLDPVRTAVLLQRHLQAHRGLASMLLNGNDSAETERHARQADVSAQLPLLHAQLGERGIAKASVEVGLMKAIWDTLSHQVDSRSISAEQSFASHTALVEQNIGVIDLVAQATGQVLDKAKGERALMLAVLCGLGLAAVGLGAVALRHLTRTPQASADAAETTSGAPTRPGAATSRLLDKVKRGAWPARQPRSDLPTRQGEHEDR